MAEQAQDLSTPEAAERGGSFLFEPVGARPFMTPEGFSSDQRQFFRTGAEFSRAEVIEERQRFAEHDYGLLRELLRQGRRAGPARCSTSPRRTAASAWTRRRRMLVAEAHERARLAGPSPSARTPASARCPSSSSARRAEGAVPAEPGHRRAGRRLRAHRAGHRLATRSARKTTAVRSRRRQALRPQRQQAVHHQRRLRRRLHRLRQGRRRASSPASSSSAHARASPSGPRSTRWASAARSTCPLIFEDAQVPVENVLGEIGKGHKIAFNILNIGRLKLGVGAVGRHEVRARASRVAYAEERKQFGTPIAQFGADPREARRHGGAHLRGRVAWPTAPPALIDARLDGATGRSRHDASRSRPSRSTRSRLDHEGLRHRGARLRSSTRRCRSSAATASSRSTRSSAPTATRASTASSRAPTRSTACSSPARCSSAR